jgi:hypothetical protein
MSALHLFTGLCFLVLAAVPATGVPIKPDIKKLAEEAQRPRPMFIPSRVGWNGPEIQTGRGVTGFEASMAPVLKAERERRWRNTLRELVIPEPRALLGVTGIIFLLRKLRSLREQQAMLARRPQPA